MVLVYAESPAGQLKKAAFEAVSYGKKVANLLGVPCAALTLGSNVSGAEALGRYGANRVFNISNEKLNHLDGQVAAAVIGAAAKALDAEVIVLSHTSTGKTIAGRLSVLLEAGLVSGVNTLPTLSGNDFHVSKSVFSGKAVATYAMNTPVKILSLLGNALRPEIQGEPVTVEPLDVAVPEGRIQVKSVKTVDGRVPLPEAEIVVSAGRGMKEASNWGIVEELADQLGATTACSRPVADSDWRPHHEHVGQTGIAIRPNLYIAIGISGAIQHLAGVNNSKVIVVINKDPEAPFFKAADYGVVGDLFEIVPRLTEAVKKFKASN